MASVSVFLVPAFFSLSTAPAQAQVRPGCWVGNFATGPNQVRGALEFTSTEDGWSGSIHRMGAAPQSDALSSVTVEGSRVNATFPSTLGTGSGSFTGEVEGGALTGAIQSGGQSLPVSVAWVDPAQPDAALELLGYWNGGLYQGGMLVLRLGVEFAPAPCGQAWVVMDSPDQGAEDIPASRLSVVGDSVVVEWASLAGTFRGTVSQAGDLLEGNWLQGGALLSIRLERGDGPVAFRRPQDPEPPLPYAEVEVSYENATDGTRFAGTLTIPEGDGPFPAALLITGSGAQDRNETVAGHRPFLVIADHLARRGIAVLRVDDRGVGGSTGNVSEATIADNVEDALAGVAFLRERSEIDPFRVGLIGHSEGGWVAPAAAARSSDIAFVVLLAGPAVSGRDLLLAQARALMEASGELLVEEGLTINGIVMDAVLIGSSEQAVLQRIQEGVEETIAASPPDRAASLRAIWELESVQANVNQGLVTMVTPWYRYLLTHEPAAHLDALEIPALALFGGRDLQVPPAQSIPVLEALWADLPDATIHLFPELNHLFQTAETGLPAEYGVIEETFAPEALEVMANWLEERFGTR